MGIDRITITAFSSWHKAHWTGCETKRQPTGHDEALEFWLDVNSRSNLQDHAQLNAVRFLGIRRKLTVRLRVRLIRQLSLWREPVDRSCALPHQQQQRRIDPVGSAR